MKAEDWISAEDKRPELDAHCLVRCLTSDGKPYIWIARYQGKRSWTSARVTHWIEIVGPKGNEI